MPKDSQAWNCYGRRTSDYLLVNYGFCFPDNLYDSYVFHLKLDVNTETDGNISVSSFVVSPVPTDIEATKTLQEVRLKRKQLNFVLISYLRSTYKNQYFRELSAPSQIFITKPAHLGLELFCLKKYSDVLQMLFDRLEKQSTVSVDEKLLKSDISDNCKMAVVYRLEKKKILLD